MPKKTPPNNPNNDHLAAFVAALDRWRDLCQSWEWRKTPRALAQYKPNPEYAKVHGAASIWLDQKCTADASEARALLTLIAEHGPAVVKAIEAQGDRERARLVFQWVESQQERQYDRWCKQVWDEVRSSVAYVQAQRGKQHVEKPPDEQPPILWSLGDHVYRVGEGKTFAVSDAEDNVLQAFLGRPAQTGEDLISTSGQTDAPRIFRRLMGRYSLGDCLRGAKARGRGGYRADVRIVEGTRV